MSEIHPENTASIVLNGVRLVVDSSHTILDVAKASGIEIPTLCHQEGWRPDGNCRACLVEVHGERTLVPSCRRLVADGIEIVTNSKRVQSVRNTVLELLATESGLTPEIIDQTTPTNELSKWLTEYNIRPRRAYDEMTHSLPKPDDSHPAFIFDQTACIQCDKCVRACQEEQENGVIGVAGRGADSKIIFGLNQSILDSPCVGCGECVQACPTQALIANQSIADSQTIESICPYCGVGCALNFHVNNGQIISVDGRDGPANHGRLCVKGRFGFDYVSSASRLTKPLVRKTGAPKDPSLLDTENLGSFDWSELFQEVSWDEALERAATGFKTIIDHHEPDCLAGLGSAKGSNEEAYLFQKLIRSGFGTNNVDHCTRLCHASSVAALLECIGSGAVSNQVQEIKYADVAFLIGCNPTVNHPVAATWIKNATKSGTKLIVADPRKTEISDFSAEFLQITPGSDIALINAMLYVVVTEDLVNKCFIDDRVDGFEAFQAHIQDFSPELMAPLCGVSPTQIRVAARLYAKADRAMIFWGMGVSQHTHGTDNVRALIALAGITGNFGQRGQGLHPLRGQNNVQGASDAGLIPMMYPNYRSVEDKNNQDWFEHFWSSSLSPKKGLTTVEIMKAVSNPNSDSPMIRGLYIMGENPAMSDPNLHHTRGALAALDHLVVQEIFMTETALLADVILPASAWPEKTGTVTNTDRVVQLGKAAVNPPGEAKADIWIIQQIAHRLGLNWAYSGEYHGVSEIYSELRDVMGESFAGIPWARLEIEKSVTYPCAKTTEEGSSVVFVDRFPTESGKMRILPTQYRGQTEKTNHTYPFSLITGRLLEHWHTGSMTRRAFTLNSLQPCPEIFLSQKDAEDLNVLNGDMVSIFSIRGDISASARIDETLAKGTVFLPFAFYEAAANILTSDQLDPNGKIPEFKHTPVQLSKSRSHRHMSGF